MDKRKPNTNALGDKWTKKQILEVWRKDNIPVHNYAVEEYRTDMCGFVIKFSEFGKKTEYGWEIDHIIPVAIGATDLIINLQALHWKVNKHKGDDINFTCPNL